MELDRVKEILSSPEEIMVHYHGIPVWIESVEEHGSMALIHARGTHDERRLVSIDELDETTKH